jgi:hypothetical protein
VQVLASGQRYDTIVAPGGPGSNLPKWPAMAGGRHVTGRDAGRGAGTAWRRPGCVRPVPARSVLVPDRPAAASDKSAEQAAGGDEALVTVVGGFALLSAAWSGRFVSARSPGRRAVGAITPFGRGLLTLPGRRLAVMDGLLSRVCAGEG